MDEDTDSEMKCFAYIWLPARISAWLHLFRKPSVWDFDLKSTEFDSDGRSRIILRRNETQEARASVLGE